MSESTDSPSSDDAVSLCSQSAYPGDDELEALETDIMVKWKLDQAPQLDYSPSGQDSQGDRPEAAVKLAESCPAQGAKGDALAPCDSAVRTDALNAALWLQRATQLDAKGELKEAFRCCAAPRPEKRSAALWKLGGKQVVRDNFAFLSLPPMLQCGFESRLGLDVSGFSMWHFLKLVVRGFLRVLRFPPLLYRLMISANKITLK